MKNKTSRGIRIEPSKINAWKCECGRWYSGGIKRCFYCGRSKPATAKQQQGVTDCAIGRANTVAECSKQQALELQAEVAEALQGFVGKCRVTIERCGKRSLDDDNFVGGAKQLRDSIAELLRKRGDAPEDGLTFRYYQRKGTPKTVITIVAE